MILLSLLLIFIGILYLYTKYQYSYWKRRGIPGPSPLPIVGNLLDTVLLRKSLAETLDDYYKKYPNLLYFGIFKFSSPTLLVRDAVLFKKILTTDFKYFADNDLFVNSKNEPEIAKTLLALKGNDWKRFRNLTNPLYTAKKIHIMYPTILRISKNFVEYLRIHGNKETGIEIRQAVGRYTTDVIYNSAFSIQSDGLSNPESEFFRETNSLFKKDTVSATIFQISLMYPTLAHVLKLCVVPTASVTWLKKLLGPSIKHRNEHYVDDFLTSILQLKEKLPDYDFTMEDITAHTIPFLTDGFETSSYAISFTLFQIASNPDVQDKVRREVEEVIKEHGSLTYESLTDLKYLECVLHETMRIYPLEAGFVKTCTKEYTMPPIDGGSGPGYTIKPGESVLLALHSLHLDSQYFPDPLKFDPERFRDDVALQRHKNAFYPFGDGPRMCIGFRFATTQIKCCIANLVQNFDISVAKGMKVPLQLDNKSLFAPAVKGGCWLTFTPR